MNKQNKLILAAIAALLIILIYCIYMTVKGLMFPGYVAGCYILGEYVTLETSNITEMELFLEECKLYYYHNPLEEKINDMINQKIAEQIYNTSH